MSLINDALKRTQQTTQTGQPPRLPELELRPIEPAALTPQGGDGSGAKRIIGLIVLVVVALNIALWLVFKDRGSQAEVAARTGEITSAAAAKSEPAHPVVKSVAAAPIQPPAVAPGSMVPSNTSTAVPEPVVEPPVQEPPAIVRPEFRLKTIVRHPTRPSAMINNRVLFVGDRVEGYAVTAIGQEEVTLTRDGDEVVVSLP
ncbi:MAG: hypothetical protein MUE94_13260 [Verrucomicrobia bacterium]|jgi:hypothetical protein|nr:hypothetical protein [Verrucomicrobiota bacterium]